MSLRISSFPIFPFGHYYTLRILDELYNMSEDYGFIRILPEYELEFLKNRYGKKILRELIRNNLIVKDREIDAYILTRLFFSLYNMLKSLLN